MTAQYQQAVTEHRQRVYSFARYSLRAAEDAEDVTQEVFTKLWQHWRKIDHSRLGAWLMRVAHNAVIDHVRKAGKHRERMDDYAEVEELEAPAEAVAERDREAFRRQLLETIRTLEDPFRSIVILRDIQGLSYQDIQRCLDISESQVKVYLHRARRKLREDARLRAMFDTWADPGDARTAWQSNQ